MLQCVAVCCSVLQCVAVCCSEVQPSQSTAGRQKAAALLLEVDFRQYAVAQR